MLESSHESKLFFLLAPSEHAVQRTDALVDKAHEEYKYRQIGLAVSIGLIGLLMIAIYLKLRQLEK